MKHMNAEMTIISKKEIGDRFQVFRDTIGKTREELSRELAIESAVIASIEQGRTFPRYEYLILLRNRYGLNINWLVGGKGTQLSSNTLEIQIASREYSRDQIEEFARILQYPALTALMLVRLVELKLIYEDELKAFFAKETNGKKDLVPG